MPRKQSKRPTKAAKRPAKKVAKKATPAPQPTRRYRIYCGFAADLELSASNQKAAEAAAVKIVRDAEAKIAKLLGVPANRCEGLVDRRHSHRIED